MDISDQSEFIQNAISRGDKGKKWLKDLPGIITEYEAKWSIKVLPPFQLTWNFVAPAIRADRKKVVIKIGFPKDLEFKREIEALKIFNGEGIERLLEEDSENCSFLIEQIKPGTPLSSLEDDEQATRILASVMKKLWKPLMANSNFTTVEEWSKAITELKQKYGKNIPHIPLYLVDKAQDLFRELIATSQKSVLTHGDLHQDNVLSSDRDGWLAIDPKGIAGEPAYETAAMIRNPYQKMRNNPNAKSIIKRIIHILSQELGFDQQRILNWAFAQTVLSAVWSIEDKGKPDHAIWIAEILNSLDL